MVVTTNRTDAGCFVFAGNCSAFCPSIFPMISVRLSLLRKNQTFYPCHILLPHSYVFHDFRKRFLVLELNSTPPKKDAVDCENTVVTIAEHVLL
ncbi:hypothetical protein TNCV_2875051 [Trichonephila clavipes]|nr:hypothetical protein TNCV_2875051 [Trichonephila clavipes]